MRFILIISALLMQCGVIFARDASVRVMSFNLWVGGEGGGQPLSQSAKVISEAKADIVGFQETHGKVEPRPDNAKALAEMLGWKYFDQGGRKAIITRFTIETNTPQKQGIVVRLPSGERFFMFNVHLFHAPYQPYQLAKIPYASGAFLNTEAQLIEAAEKARGHEVTTLLSELAIARMSGLPVFLTGDFNEPSHLDWSEAAAKAGKVPMKVEFPATRRVMEAGMRDAFRELYPDPVKVRGLTWTPLTAEDDPKDRHDRIDFVFFSGDRVKLRRCEIVGEKSSRADIVVQPYPSDHRSLVGTFSLGGK